jgi:RNA-directed DNA polymerase
VYTINGTNPTADFYRNGYRLPTETEWEFAARGGISSQGYTYSGSNNVDTVGWYYLNSGNTVYEPKPRLISSAPFRDRVVHHALCNIVEPPFDRAFIQDSYATPLGKSSHRALVHFHGILRRSGYVLKCDVRKYFPSIDHEILKSLVARRIKCGRTLALIGKIIDSSNPQEPREVYFPGDGLFDPFTRRRGLPIGNLTSQFFANVYLDPVDHWIEERLGCRMYLRYMDDFCLFSDSKEELRYWLDAIRRKLVEFRLELKEPKTRIYRCDEGVEYPGFRLFPEHRRLNVATARRAQLRLKSTYAAMRWGDVTPEEFRQRLVSWLGHAGWGNTQGLVRDVMEHAGCAPDQSAASK